ncbi:MAG: glycosyltransferase family 9 protein [Saprospiraceae bacterium]
MKKKILIIRFSSIGDIVLTTPVIRVLHEQIGAKVHYLTKPSFASIIEVNPNVTKVYTLQEDFDQMIRMLRDEQYDYIIDLHNNIRTRRIKLSLKRPSHSFRKLNFEKWLMVNFKINRLPDKHIVDRYLDTVNFLGVQNDRKGLDFFTPEEKKINVLEKFGFQPNTYVSIVIGATYYTKCLTVDQIAAICEILNMPVLLLGGKQEIKKGQEILNLSKSKNIISACGTFDIFQSASILQQSATIISHDTGLMHIAAALKKPQVVIWGNTIPAFGMYPYYGDENKNINWISFEQKELNCRPCTKLGFDKCPKGHFKCILNHNLSEIASATLNLIRPEDQKNAPMHNS